MMAPRTTWKGLLTLARVSCPVRLYPAVIRVERLGFQALNRATLNRVQMRPHDPQTGREVSRDAMVRGYEVEAGQYVLIEDRELAELQISSSRNLLLERFVAPASIDIAYLDTSYFLVPEGSVAETAFGVIREAMAQEGMVGVSRIVLASRERTAIIEPRGRGMLLTTLRAAHEVRSDESYFAEISAAPPNEAMVELARRIIGRLTTSFDPKRDFRDRYQEALFHFVQAKRRGEKPVVSQPSAPAVVIDLKEALERSIAAAEEPKPPAPSRHPATPRRSTKRPSRPR
jgi:DNA end-binding protein Ku